MTTTIAALVAVRGLASTAALPATGEVPFRRSNILFILVDDYRINDVGIEGSTVYQTPDTDALARGGMRFTQGYAACQMCSPWRASALLQLVGLPLRPQQRVDGVSLVPRLNDSRIADSPLFWHYPHYGNQGGEPSSIIREAVWKPIHDWEDGRNERYHLPNDIGEQQNLAQPEPARGGRRPIRTTTKPGGRHRSKPCGPRRRAGSGNTPITASRIGNPIPPDGGI